jgi:hypothetical protein
MDRTRVGLASGIKSRIFVCYLAYLLLSMLSYRLKDLKMTGTDALAFLQTMCRVFLTDPKSKNRFVEIVALSRVTLATNIPEERCRRINPGYLDPATRKIDECRGRETRVCSWCRAPEKFCTR